MGKVVLVSAVWPATGSKFMQAFDNYESALAKLRDLREDSDVVARIISTDFDSIDDIGLMLSGDQNTTPSGTTIQ